MDRVRKTLGLESGEASDSQPKGTKQFNLDPWNGDKVPLDPVGPHRSRRAMDFIRWRQKEAEPSDSDNRQLVRDQIKIFNNLLDEMKGLNLDYLPQDLRKAIKDQIIGMTNKFAQYSQEALGDHGNPFTRGKGEKLEKLYNDLTEMYRGLDTAAEKWPDLSAMLTSFRQGQDVFRELDRLPRGSRRVIMDQIDQAERMISDGFARHLQDFLDASKDLPTRQKADQELDKLYTVLTEMSDDLNRAKEIWPIIDANLTSILQNTDIHHFLRHLQKDSKQKDSEQEIIINQVVSQITKMDNDFVQYSQEAFVDYGSPSTHDQRQHAFTELEKLHTVLTGMSDNLNRAKETWLLFYAKRDSIREDPNICRVLDQGQKKQIMDHFERMSNDFAKRFQEFLDTSKDQLTRENACRKLDELYNVLTESINKLYEITIASDKFKACQECIPEGIRDLARRKFATSVKLFNRALIAYNEEILEIGDKAKESTSAHQENMDKAIKLVNDISENAYKYYEAHKYYRAYRKRFEDISKRIDDCKKRFQENCPPSSPSQKPELNELWSIFHQNSTNADTIQSKITTANQYDKSLLEELVKSYEQEAIMMAKTALKVIYHSPQVSRYYKPLAVLMKRTEQAAQVAIYVIDNNNLTEEEKQTLVNEYHALHENAYRSIVDAMRACGPQRLFEEVNPTVPDSGQEEKNEPKAGEGKRVQETSPSQTVSQEASEQIDKAITEAQQNVKSFQLFPFGKSHDILAGSHDLPNKVDKIWEAFDEIEEHQSSLWPEAWNIINNGINKAYNDINKSISTLSNYTKSSDKSRKKALMCLEEIIKWQKKTQDYTRKNDKKRIEYIIMYDEIEKIFKAWEGWFNRNCPQELQYIRDKFNQELENATQTKLKIDREIGNNNALKLERITHYYEQIPGFEEMALEVIRNSSEVSQYYDDLTTLKKRAENAKAAALKGIDRKSDLPDEEKQTLINDSAELFNKASDARMDAVRAYGPKENLKQRNDAIVKAKKTVLEVEMNMLEHSRPLDHQILSGLISRFEKAAKMAKKYFNNNKYYKEEKNQKIPERFNSLHKDTYHSIAQSIEICADHEKSGQRDKAIREAQQYVESFQLFLQFASTKERVPGWLDWLTRNGPSSNVISSESELFRKKLDTAKRKVTEIEQQITEAKSGDAGSLLKHFKSYKEVALKIDRLAWDVIEGTPYYGVLHNLLTQAEKAKEAALEGINQKDNLPEEEMRALSNDAAGLFDEVRNAIMDAVRACGPKEDPNQRDNAITEAKKRVLEYYHPLFLDREQFESTNEKVTHQLDWLTRNGPSSEDKTPEAEFFRKRLATAERKVTEIKQQITDPEPGNVSSLLEHLESYKEMARKIDEWAREGGGA